MASFSRTHRIRGRTTFGRLSSGRRCRQGPLTVTFLSADSSAPPEVGYSVGRKVGTAVVRNRLRRQLRAVIRTVPLSSGAYVVHVSPSAVGSSSLELRRWLVAATNRLERARG